MNLFRQLRLIGWAAIEAAFLLIVLCLLLDIIIGSQSGSFVTQVAKNATAFLQAIPPGLVVGVGALAVVWGFLKGRLLP